MRYSGLKVITEGLFGNRGWKPAWRDPAPKAEYDAIIIGGGGHGLSTAYYLAKNHGMTNIAVLEKGYLGSGNIGRNTTIVRANYILPGNSEFYSHSLKLWEGLEAELNYNVMHSQRGLINLFHSDGQRDAFVRRGNSMINQGDDAILLDREGCASICPTSTSTTPAFRSTAACCTRAAARRGMMRWPGAMPGRPTGGGWT